MSVTAVNGTYFGGSTGTTSYGSNLLFTKYHREIEPAVYENGTFFPLIEEAERPFNSLIIRKLAQFAAPTTLAATADGSGLTYNAAVDSQVTLTPVMKYQAVAVSELQMLQMETELPPVIKDALPDRLAQTVDADCLADVATLTTTLLGTDGQLFSKAFLALALSAGRTASRSAWKGTKYLVYHTNRMQDVLMIPELTAANLRGDSSNPNVSGVVLNGLGIEHHESANVYVDANAIAYNVMFRPSAFRIAFNLRPGMKVQDYELQTRIIVRANYAHAVAWDDRAVMLKTKSSLT